MEKVNEYHTTALRKFVLPYLAGGTAIEPIPLTTAPVSKLTKLMPSTSTLVGEPVRGISLPIHKPAPPTPSLYANSILPLLTALILLKTPFLPSSTNLPDLNNTLPSA
jgi:hypothetical protein